MKRWNILYENTKLPIRIVVFGWVLLAIGYLITNDNVNTFYTITNPVILIIARISSQIGHVIIMNMPLIFMIGIVAKRANSGAPALFAIAGYITYLVVLMLLGPNDYSAQVYTNNLGISYAMQSQSGSSVLYPMQTGMVGSFIVAMITRYSYIKSRHRSIYSLLGFTHKDTAGLIYNIILCALAGVAMAYVWPYVVDMILDLIAWIASDISDPLHLSAYGILDRVTSVLGLGNIVRYPFWYGIEGGTYSSLAGQTILGDVNIWKEMPGALASFSGAGRFITPYYVINMFVCPSVYLAYYFSYSDRKERHKMILYTAGAMILSFICGNPLPMELLLLFNAPLLLIIHLLLSGSLFGILFANNAFLGFSYSGSTVSAMPGAFPDFIINARTPQYIHSLLVIVVIGLIYAIIYFLLTRGYFEFAAYDIVSSNRSKTIARKVIDAVGGIGNITTLNSTPHNLEIRIESLEDVSYEKLKQVGAWRVRETRDELVLEFGSSSTILRKNIQKIINESKRVYKEN